MTLLAIDPAWAKPGSACASFDGDALRATCFWDWRVEPRAPVRPDWLVIERPQVDDRTANVRESYEKLWAAYEHATDRCSLLGARVRRYTPRQWKGGASKPLHHRRVWDELTPAERAVLPPDTAERIERACERGGLNRWSKPGATYYGSWKGHNTLDAVGLGLFHLGRIGK